MEFKLLRKNAVTIPTAALFNMIITILTFHSWKFIIDLDNFHDKFKIHFTKSEMKSFQLNYSEIVEHPENLTHKIYYYKFTSKTFPTHHVIRLFHKTKYNLFFFFYFLTHLLQHKKINNRIYTQNIPYDTF